ncbi:MAG: BtpA/SgcQ family protein [Woeseiaceae bacterium]
MARFSDYFNHPKPVIGMIHLPPLPGYKGTRGIDHAISHAVANLHVLEECGVDGVLVENEYDRPHRVEAPPETVAAMTRITRAVVQESESAVIGCEILLNDPQASLAVAESAGAAFIRTDYFVDRMTRPEYGEFCIDPDALIAYRRSIGAEHILILADIQVKYATMVIPRPLSSSARLAAEKGADAVIATGDQSGDAPSVGQLREVAHCGVPVLIGSGLNTKNASALLAECDGAIVGTSIMQRKSVDFDALELLMSNLDRKSK